MEYKPIERAKCKRLDRTTCMGLFTVAKVLCKPHLENVTGHSKSTRIGPYSEFQKHMMGHVWDLAQHGYTFEIWNTDHF